MIPNSKCGKMEIRSTLNFLDEDKVGLWLHAMEAVSSTLLLKVKYPFGDQVEELIGSQDMAR